MRRARLALLAAGLLGCASPLAAGERSYREGDRLGALETWRAIPEDASDYDEARERIAVVEEEFHQLVVRYKKRAVYFEDKDRLAESILNYRLALKLQPHDATTLEHVQEQARLVAARKQELDREYRAAFSRGDLAAARDSLDRLRSLDPFDPELETDERQLHEALRDAVGEQLALGQRALMAGRTAAARAAFLRALELDPGEESARGYLSYIETIERESDRAGERPAGFQAGDRFASDAQIRAEGFYQNALSADRAGDPYSAIRHDLRALRANPEHDAAGKHLRALRARLLGRVGGLIEAGREAFRNEDLQSALDLWRNALLIEPGNERAQAYVGRAERQLQNLERLRSEPDVSARGE